MTTEEWKNCPRCEVPMNPRDYPAISRTDDKTHVCGRCGIDEAIEAWMNGEPTPKSKWPIEPQIHTTLANGNVTLSRPIPARKKQVDRW